MKPGCKKGYKFDKKKGICKKVDKEKSKRKKRKKSFIKNNWDLLLTIILPILGGILTFGGIELFGTGDWGDLVFGLFIVGGISLGIIFLIISIIRSIFKKQLNKKRWIFLGIIFITLIIIFIKEPYLNPLKWLGVSQ